MAVPEFFHRVKQEAPGIPVTYADVYGILLGHPTLLNSIDVIMVNYYPYWEGINVDQAVATFHTWHQKIIAAAGSKNVIVSETGWPSEGNQIGDAVPSPDNASFYFLNFISWARANNVEYFYFSSFDETWKTQYEGPQGAHWGVWDKFGNLKPGMQAVFDGETMEDNWSGDSIPGGPGTPSIEFTYVPPYNSIDNLKGQIWHISPNDYKVAVYIYVPGAGWWTKPYFASPLTSIIAGGSWICDITTGGNDQTATKIAAYLTPNGYNPPTVGGAGTLPQELENNASAKAECTRNPDASIVVTSPNGGENWIVGTNQTITWTSSGSVGNLKIQYSKDSGAHWITIATSIENNGNYTWMIPNTPSNNNLV